MRTKVKHDTSPVKRPGATYEWNNSISDDVTENAPRWSATVGPHLTPEEIALNQQELACRAEIEKLEIQEAQLDLELEQDIGESGKMLVMYTLQALHKEFLAKHRKLERI
jgi:hypothetical protein